MRILYVSPYPPLRDGIAAYAVQDVARLRRDGHDVEVLSPGASAAHHHLDLHGARGALALGKRVRSYDRVIVQFHPDFFFRVPASHAERVATSAALGLTFRLARELHVVVHEIDYRAGFGAGSRAARAMWRGADRVLLHTEEERRRFLEAFRVPASRASLVEHGEAFVRRTRHDRASARDSLAIPQDSTVFLAIGFIQPHKGFDRAVRAFRGLGEHDARLYVVGSLRLEDGAYVHYLDELRALIAQTPGASLELGYVSDELFDRWLVAADEVVLPYRHIWSSGVLERAALYGRPATITAVGGLLDQVADRTDVTVVRTDRDLRHAMWKRAGASEAVVGEPWPYDGAGLRERIQAEIVSRAAQRRGGPVEASATARKVATGTVSLSAPVRAVPVITPPAPVSGRPGATILKRVVRRATGWMLDPLYWQVNAIRDGVIRSLDEVEKQEGQHR